MNDVIRRISMEPGTCYELEVSPTIPARIARLAELADDLYYSWVNEVRLLFSQLDRELWDQCGHNPKLFLRRISQEQLDEAAQDPIFMQRYSSALSAYDSYHQHTNGTGPASQWLSGGADLVAYFCAEFGFHESLPIYSGGLGILAGDYCKAASDLHLPFVAVGLLYRQGYFTQTIDAYGNQVATFTASDFSHLPISPARDTNGDPVRVTVNLEDRAVVVNVWRAKAGRVCLYLLDTDVPENSFADRAITQQLYVADRTVRLRQEMVLGIGGVRALRALGLRPAVWHINEGHPAFVVLERCREQIVGGMEFDAAFEITTANTIFTTHTPVPAGHDVFDHGAIRHYFAELVAELGISIEQLLELGACPSGHGEFNMSALAVRGSRFQNGVSRIHGQVAADMFSYAWPQVPQEENPVGFVTNGVHLSTFLGREWHALFDLTFGNEWRRQLTNDEYWKRVDEIPDYQYWSTRQGGKSRLLRELRRRATAQFKRNGYSGVEIARLTRQLTPENTELLIIGFARRFATYKRATLIFSDVKRLARLLGDPARPTLLVFGGKAHPNDLAGQQLIQAIHQLSRHPDFEGKLLLIEGYDMALARHLMAGVDVWLNTPEYPMEASGTSGQKAGLNGALNLSVLDGWWAEGFNGRNGWGIPPHRTTYTDAADRDRIEAHEILQALEYEVLPLFFERNGQGYSEAWVRRSKASMQSILPRFNSQRMVLDYVRDYYVPARRHHERLASDHGRPAAELAAWRQRVAVSWPRVQVRRVDAHVPRVAADAPLKIVVAVRLGTLDVGDVRVECIFGRQSDEHGFVTHSSVELQPSGFNDDGEALYHLESRPPLSGLQFYKLRAHPFHPLLRHPFGAGRMVWV
ncbi:MAG: alpha-glucan family phosphorylase [Candidatus Binatia bacterium]